MSHNHRTDQLSLPSFLLLIDLKRRKAARTRTLCGARALLLPAGDGNFYFSCRDSGVKRVELPDRSHHLASRSIRELVEGKSGKKGGGGREETREVMQDQRRQRSRDGG